MTQKRLISKKTHLIKKKKKGLNTLVSEGFYNFS